MSEALSLVLHNVTEEAEVLNVLHDFTVGTVAPAALLESFLLGRVSNLQPSLSTQVFCRRLHGLRVARLVHAMVNIEAQDTGQSNNSHMN